MTLPQASKWKETYFVISKLLYCLTTIFKHFFKVGKVLGEVWVADVCSKKIPTLK